MFVGMFVSWHDAHELGDDTTAVNNKGTDHEQIVSVVNATDEACAYTNTDTRVMV